MELNDEQNWLIVNTQPDASSASLVRSLGMLASTIAHARIRMQRRGWTCSAAYVVCQECGELLTYHQVKHRQRRYHPICCVIVSQRSERSRNRQRWEAMDDVSRNADIERARNCTVEAQRTSQQHAKQHRATWTNEEDAILMDHAATDILSISRLLDRTYWAVDSRRRRLRKRGLLD